ncbi:HD domain-containing protein [Clostridium sp.]|uniref:HD-GYP domain-containing protein n=1 Tax=Clostridium sp. TaxID=1506 RepID=UPI001A5FF52D|nr:HD domain-containing protein [Clostridium sp.]MBK5239645.1 HD domain-containing protein [Clostridium sp.]
MNVSKKSLIEGLSYALDIAEGSYFSHSKHVAYTSVLIGKSLNLSNERLSELYYVALLHDIGADEHYNIKSHSEIGARTAKRLNLSQNSIDAIKYHHEYSNGTGINGLTNDKIHLMAKIILLANLLDLKIQEYKKNLSEEITFEMHHRLIDHLNSIKHLVDPIILEHLLKLVNQPYFLLSYLNIRHNDIQLQIKLVLINHFSRVNLWLKII